MSASSPISIQGLATLARQEGGPPPEEVARQFETLLIGEMLRPASKPLFEGGLLDGGSAGQMYREHFFQEVARLTASSGSFGLAQQIERELGRTAHPVQGEPEVDANPVQDEPDVTAKPAGNEPDVTAKPAGNEPDVTAKPAGNEPDVSASTERGR